MRLISVDEDAGDATKLARAFEQLHGAINLAIEVQALNETVALQHVDTVETIGRLRKNVFAPLEIVGLLQEARGAMRDVIETCVAAREESLYPQSPTVERQLQTVANSCAQLNQCFDAKTLLTPKARGALKLMIGEFLDLLEMVASVKPKEMAAPHK